jgi:D-3-phosphoglycerate dehydrogenase
MTTPFVAVTDSPAGEDLSVEREVLAGMNVNRVAWQDPESLTSAVRHADAILCMHAPFNEAVVHSLTSCKVIVRFGTGLDNINRAAAATMKIPVVGVADYCSQEVANHTWAMLLAWNRKLFQYQDFIREKRWNERAVATGVWGCGPITRLSGQVLGIVGFGPIGRAVATRAQAFGMTVLVYTRHPDDALAESMRVEFTTPEDLLRRSDYVSLHMALTPETRHIINRDRIPLMKPSAIFMNTSRGNLVDEDALVEALASGRLGGALLDVFAQAPLPLEHPFRNMKNVILTPWVGFYSEEALLELRRRAAEAVRSHLTAH